MSRSEDPTTELHTTSVPPDSGSEHREQNGDTTRDPTPNAQVVVQQPSVIQKLRTIQRRLKKWTVYWIKEFRTPIEILPRYSPRRFSSGLSPVTLRLKGVGICIYNGRVKGFHNQFIRLTVPLNTSTPVVCIGYRQLCKYTLHAISSISHIPPFSIQSDNDYAKVIPIAPVLKTQQTSLHIPRIRIQAPSIQYIEVNLDQLEDLRSEFEESP